MSLSTMYTRGVPFIQDSAAPGVAISPPGLGGANLKALADKVLENQDRIVCVTDYGATGDGVADDTAEIQAAIDAVEAAGGGIVFFPLGTFLISASITIENNNVTLDGLGRGSIVKSLTNDEIIRADSVSGVVIRNIAILGSANAAHTLQRGIQFINVTDSIVENVHVKNVGYDGILLLYGCVGNTIANCHVDGAGDDGINIGGDLTGTTSDNTIVGNVCENCGSDGIHVSQGSTRTTATGNSIFACGGGISLFATSSVTIAGNTIYNCTGNGIDTPDGPNTDFVIQGNVIQSCARGMSLTECSRYTISGNTIRSCTTYGIAIVESPVANVDAVISNNTISGGVTTAGILVSGAKNVVIDGNSFISLTGDGVYIKSASGFECSFVSVVNNHFRAIGDEGVEVEAGTLSAHLTIRGNSFRDITGRAIEYRGGAYFQINDNRCIDSSDFTILISANSAQAGFGTVERNIVIGGGSSEGIRVNNYDDVLVRDNTVTGIGGSIGVNSPAGYRVILNNNLSDKTISGGCQDKMVLSDHFTYPTLSSQWTVAKGSDAQCVDFAVLASQIGGVIRGTTGDDAANTVAVNGVQICGQLNWRASLSGLVAEFRLALNSITNEAFFFGFTDQVAALEMPFTYSGTTLTSVATDAVGVLFDTDATTDNWKLVGVANNVDATVQDAGVAPVAGVFEEWRIEVSAAGAAKFFRNGAAIGSTMAGAVTAGTALAPVIVGFSHTTVSKNFDVDQVRIAANR